MAKKPVNERPTLEQLDAQIEAARQEHEALSAQRASIVLDGGDVEEYHRKLFDGAERIKTLTAARTAREKEIQADVQAQKKAELEREAGKIRSEAEKLADHWREFHKAIAAVQEAGERLAASKQKIMAFNDVAARQQRADLSVDIPRVRQKVAFEISGGVAAGPINISRNSGESDAAFELRRLNAESRRVDKAKAADPFLSDGDKAQAVIEELCFAMGPHERQRNRRMVNARSYVMPDGQAVKTIADVPGSAMAVPGKFYHGPYGPGGDDSAVR